MGAHVPIQKGGIVIKTWRKMCALQVPSSCHVLMPRISLASRYWTTFECVDILTYVYLVYVQVNDLESLPYISHVSDWPDNVLL